MMAIDWGWSSIEQVVERLMEESAKARENGHNCALTTARNAGPRRYAPAGAPIPPAIPEARTRAGRVVIDK